MSAMVNVRVTWSQSKLNQLPSSGTYSTVARFAEDTDWPNGDTWSVVLEFDTSEAQHPEFYARAKFLSPVAPMDRLRKGESFDLYEGRTATAHVTVL
jgi:hypothetical protein